MFLFHVTESITKVSCVLNENCILPCQFQGHITAVNWQHVTRLTRTPICEYSHYGAKATHWCKNSSERASLFEDQTSRGNFSLLLRGVKLQDEGEYSCSAFTRTYARNIVALKVEGRTSFFENYLFK